MFNALFTAMGSEYVMKLTGARGQTRHEPRPDLALFDTDELDAYMKKRVCASSRLRMRLTELSALACCESEAEKEAPQHP